MGDIQENKGKTREEITKGSHGMPKCRELMVIKWTNLICKSLDGNKIWFWFVQSSAFHVTIDWAQLRYFNYNWLALIDSHRSAMVNHHEHNQEIVCQRNQLIHQMTIILTMIHIIISATLLYTGPLYDKTPYHMSIPHWCWMGSWTFLMAILSIFIMSLGFTMIWNGQKYLDTTVASISITSP
jgi:hypothetical protein